MRQFKLLERSDGSWLIIESSCESVFPQTHKPTARAMIARLSQLLDVGPVAPQSWPEKVCLVEKEHDWKVRCFKHGWASNDTSCPECEK